MSTSRQPDPVNDAAAATLERARCVIGVVPHPDDEAYAMAGTLALAAARGARVAVLCATRGEGGGDPRVRSAELAASCALLGAGQPEFLDWEDGAVAQRPGDRAAADLRAALRSLAGACPGDALVLLGLGADGVYGHTDHLALHRLLRRAVAGWLADAGADVDTTRGRPAAPTLLEAAFAPGHFHRVWRGLRRAGFAGVPKGWGPERFGVRGCDVSVDLAPVHGVKRAAIACHASQLGGRAPEDFLAPGLMAPLLLRERWLAVSPRQLAEVAP